MTQGRVNAGVQRESMERVDVARLTLVVWVRFGGRHVLVNGVRTCVARFRQNPIQQVQGGTVGFEVIAQLLEVLPLWQRGDVL